MFLMTCVFLKKNFWQLTSLSLALGMSRGQEVDHLFQAGLTKANFVICAALNLDSICAFLLQLTPHQLHG